MYLAKKTPKGSGLFDSEVLEISLVSMTNRFLALPLRVVDARRPVGLRIPDPQDHRVIKEA
jgi:hypothetical protein